MRVIRPLPPLSELYNIYLAIPLSDNAKKELLPRVTALKKLNLPLTYQNVETAHITLHFWKNIDDAIFEEIMRFGESVEKNIQSFALLLCDIGFFPSDIYSRIMWMEIDDRNKIKDLIKIKSWKDDKPFHAHATIGRIKIAQSFLHSMDAVRDIFKDIKIESRCDRITLNAAYGNVRQIPFLEWPLA